ncbi:MAG: DUF3098 domain-containing protein [Cytophagales bacterium]|nr:DUF3098 domain-containing protein [Cytophagales bacterium]
MQPQRLLFSKINYYILLAGVFIIVLGFVLMGLDKEPYGFGVLGITIAPIVVLSGFGLQFWAIFAKGKQ